MSFGKLAKSNQEQAVASWINYLNQVRLDQLMYVLNRQDKNLATALRTLDDTLDIISCNIIDRNRGGIKGMHGFIAEIAECGIGNAREEIKGGMPIYKWINDNGPADMLRDRVQIQQKFVSAGNHLSLHAIKQHFSTYPWFLQEGGKYQIPSDHYEKIKYLLSISPEQANKMPTATGEFSLKQWREVQEFFRNGYIKLENIEPSKLNYKAVQANAIHGTIDEEKGSIKETDRKLRKGAYDASKPTLKQGAEAAAVSAVVEGGAAFISGIIKLRKSGKKIQEFTPNDWTEIAKESGLGMVKGGIRGSSIYALTNLTVTPAAVASSLCTASFGIAEQTYLFRNGSINEEQFIMNAEILCLDCSVSALSSFIGQAVIPVPILGAVIGNTVGTFMYQIAKDNLSKREQCIVAGYLKELELLDKQLEEEYRAYIDELNTALHRYYGILERAFAPDYEVAFEGSIALAVEVGVPRRQILRSMSDIDNYFLE